MEPELNEKINWSALEYADKEKSKDWFWALGIIVITSSIAAIIFNDYFFAVLLVLAGILLGFFAIKKPDTIFYELNDKGLKIGNHLYLFENIKSFWIQIEEPRSANQHNSEVVIKPLLFIHSERIFMPIILIPIDELIAKDIYTLMLSKNIPEVEMKENISEKIMEVLGF